MKRLLSFFLVIACLATLPYIVLAEDSSWPQLDPEWSDAALRDPGDTSTRRQAYYGPGKKYATAGAYKPYKVEKARALFQEGDYTLVELDYPTVGKRCVYFNSSMLREVPDSTFLLEPYPAQTDTMLIPMLGPGNDYDYLVYLTQSDDLSGLDGSLETMVELFAGSWEIYQALKLEDNTMRLPAGTEIGVLFETNGWVFAEFTSAIGLVRAWFPADFVH